jgi:hypothetical protein
LFLGAQYVRSYRINNHQLLGTYMYSLEVFENMEVEEVVVRGREAHETVHKKRVGGIITLFERLTLISKESESGPTMNAHEFINSELESNLNNPTYLLRRKLWVCLMEKGMQLAMNPLKKDDNVQIRDVMVAR